MAILGGVLRSRFLRPVGGVGVRRKEPTFEDRVRFMQSLGRSPMEAIAAARAGVLLEAKKPGPEEIAQRRKEEQDAAKKEAQAEREQAEKAKEDLEQFRREEALSALGIDGDIRADERDLVGLIRVGAAKPLDLLRFRQRRAVTQAAGQKALVGGIGKRIGGGISRIAEFAERTRGGIQQFLGRGQEIEARRQREQEAADTRALEEAEAHEARVLALQAGRGLTAKQAEILAAGKLLPLQGRVPETAAFDKSRRQRIWSQDLRKADQLRATGQEAEATVIESRVAKEKTLFAQRRAAPAAPEIPTEAPIFSEELVAKFMARSASERADFIRRLRAQGLDEKADFLEQQ